MKDVHVIVEFVKTSSAAVMATNWFYDKKKMLLKATGQKNLKTFPNETKLLKKCGLHIKIEIQIRVIGKAGGFMYFKNFIG